MNNGPGVRIQTSIIFDCFLFANLQRVHAGGEGRPKELGPEEISGVKTWLDKAPRGKEESILGEREETCVQDFSKKKKNVLAYLFEFRRVRNSFVLYCSAYFFRRNFSWEIVLEFRPHAKKILCEE